jgi:gas vesicle protein
LYTVFHTTLYQNLPNCLILRDSGLWHKIDLFSTQIIKSNHLIKKIMNDSSKVLLTFIGGAVVGAALGILFAPDKGSVTRKKLAKSATDLKDELADTASEKYQEFLDWKDRMMEKEEEAEGKLKSAVNRATDHVANKVDSAKKAV